MDKIQPNIQKNIDGSVTYSLTFMPTLEKSFLEQEEEIAELAATFGRMVTEQLLEKLSVLQISGKIILSRHCQNRFPFVVANEWHKIFHVPIQFDRP